MREADERIRVLCVDDEQNVLDGLSTSLRKGFNVSTALSGEEGLKLLEVFPPPMVVVSDMRMPGMDGATFLTHVRERLPHAIRILLTGHADIESAIAAVNEGQVFRFLSKPCPARTFHEVLRQAGEHYRLVTAQRVLLEETLLGIVQALTSTLAMANPMAFSRADRIRKLAGEVAERLPGCSRWEVEVATMLSQAASVALPADVVEKLYAGEPLSEAEETMVARMPATAQGLVANIPRLDGVRAILSGLHHQAESMKAASGPADPDQPKGAQILQAVFDLEACLSRGLSPQQALQTLQGQVGESPELLEALTKSVELTIINKSKRAVELCDLREGMVIAEDLTCGGTLLVSAGHVVTSMLRERLRNYAEGLSNGHLVLKVNAEPWDDDTSNETGKRADGRALAAVGPSEPTRSQS